MTQTPLHELLQEATFQDQIMLEQGSWLGIKRRSWESGKQDPRLQGFAIFVEHATDPDPIQGTLEPHQLQEGRSPTLLSLHAQPHLGCSKTGLLMISLTGEMPPGTSTVCRGVIESFAVATWLEMLHRFLQNVGRVPIQP